MRYQQSMKKNKRRDQRMLINLNEMWNLANSGAPGGASTPPKVSFEAEGCQQILYPPTPTGSA